MRINGLLQILKRCLTHNLLITVPVLLSILLFLIRPDCHTTEEAIVLILFFIVLAIKLANDFSWCVGLAFGYFSIMNTPKIIVPFIFWKEFSLQAIISFSSMVRHSQLYLTCFAVFFLFFKKLKEIETIIIVLSVINAIALYIRHIQFGQAYFLFNNSAIDCSFIACSAPIIYKKLKDNFTGTTTFLIMSVILGPLFFTKTSSGTLGLGLLIFFWFFWNRKKIIGFLLMSSVGAAGYLMTKDNPHLNLLDSNGRTFVWQLTMKYWFEHISHFFGSGTGTFFVYGPAIQIEHAMTLPHKEEMTLPGFTWMHNDWLQILFEGGYVGLVLSAIVYFMALYKLRKTPHLFTSLFIFGTLAFIQMPLRWAIFSMLGAFLLVNAFNPTEEQNSY